jgi:hypothetical protein
VKVGAKSKRKVLCLPQKLAYSESNGSAEDDRCVIIPTNSLIFDFPIFEINHKIEPAACVAVRLNAIGHMNAEAQDHENNEEENGFGQTKQKPIEYKDAQDKEDLEDFVPGRLQCVTFYKIGIIPDTIK